MCIEPPFPLDVVIVAKGSFKEGVFDQVSVPGEDLKTTIDTAFANVWCALSIKN